MTVLWMTFVKHSFDIIKEAEASVGIVLDHETEAYLVHTFSSFMDKPLINTTPMCIKYMSGLSLPKPQKKKVMREVAEECLLINGLSLGSNRWPSKSYFTDLGQIAYSSLAYVDNPPELFYDKLAGKFRLMSKVLSACKSK